MKKQFLLVLMGMLLLPVTLWAQAPRVSFMGSYYYNGDVVYVPCGNFQTSVQGSLYYSGSYHSSYIDNGQVVGQTAIPSGWTMLGQPNPGSPYTNKTSLDIDANPSGVSTCNFYIYDQNSPAQPEMITLTIAPFPKIEFSSTPSLTSANQSNTYSVQLASSNASYSNMIWESKGGIRVNSGTYSSTGLSATVGTTSWGGRLTVRAQNSCGLGPILERTIWTPYIYSNRVNSSAPQYPNSVPGGAYLWTDTDGTATSYSWSLDGGSGYYYPSFNSCTAYPTPFMRVLVSPSNSNGTGETFTYWLLDPNYSGFRMASPNPTNDRVTIAFDYPEIAEDLLKEVQLVNESGTPVRGFDVSAAKARKQFKTDQTINLDVKGLKNGTYYLQVRIGDKLNVERIQIGESIK